MPFFTYVQNNSYGSFDYDEDAGIAPYVIMEAEDAGWSDVKAKRVGLYFDGCADGVDCECCGDRWYPADAFWKGDESDEVPSIYQTPVSENYVQAPKAPSVHGIRAEHKYEVFVHYNDGRIEGWSAIPNGEERREAGD